MLLQLLVPVTIASFSDSVARVAAQVDYAQYVNPLIGSEGPMPGQACGSLCMSLPNNPSDRLQMVVETYSSAQRSHSAWQRLALTHTKILPTFPPPMAVTPLEALSLVSAYFMNQVSGHRVLPKDDMILIGGCEGTGGGPKYGFPAQMPLTNIDESTNFLLDNRTYWQQRVPSHLQVNAWYHMLTSMQVGRDSASVGHYKTLLQNGVSVELSASRHAGIMQYSFQHGKKNILVDLSHVRRPSLLVDYCCDLTKSIVSSEYCKSIRFTILRR